MPAKGFFDLPLEIRDQIYRLCTPEIAVVTTWGEEYFVQNEGNIFCSKETAITPVIRERGGDSSKHTAEPVPVLHLNRAIRAEALTLMYREKTFATTLSPWNTFSRLSNNLMRNKLAVEHFCLRSRNRAQDYSSQILEPFVLARNWLLTLHWNSAHSADSRQYIEIREEVLCVVEMLERNKNLRNVTVEYPCECSFLYGGYEDPTKMVGYLSEESDYRRARAWEAMRMVVPMTRLRVTGKAVMRPMVSKIMGLFPRMQKCEEWSCQQFAMEIESCMEGTMGGIENFGSDWAECAGLRKA
ncbi:MAG: hypothetical protein Q9202_002340 [Teloschistes flavicans]